MNEKMKVFGINYMFQYNLNVITSEYKTAVQACHLANFDKSNL